MLQTGCPRWVRSGSPPDAHLGWEAHQLTVRLSMAPCRKLQMDPLGMHSPSPGGIGGLHPNDGHWSDSIKTAPLSGILWGLTATSPSLSQGGLQALPLLRGRAWGLER